MPKPSKPSTDYAEQEAAVRMILRSKDFRKAPMRTAILRYLGKNQDRFSSEIDIARDVFKIPPDQVRGTRVRGQCIDLREKLEDYDRNDVSSSGWRCLLPGDSRGYKIKFSHRSLIETAGGAFWDAHVSPRINILIVCNEPLFFRDTVKNIVFRHMEDLIEETDNAGVLNALQAAHPETYPESYKDTLYPCHLYLLSGEIAARDAIQNWLRDSAGTRSQMRISSDLTTRDYAENSLILLGSSRTNKAIRQIRDMERYKSLAYRMEAKRFGVVQIVAPTPAEEQALVRIDQGNIEKNEGQYLLHDSAKAEKNVFCIVTRIPSPYGAGAVTIISTNYTRVLHQVSQTLTQELRLEKLLTQLEWGHDASAPKAFQLLFSVRMGPLGIDADAGKPELIASREYPELS